jgi:predicted dehydrogenase
LYGVTEDENTLNIGLVGLGYWGPNLLRALVEMDGVEVRRICDIDSSRLSRFTRRYPSITPTAEFDDLLKDPELDAVIIATPVFTHFDLARRSLEAGKHTFVEKPLAPSSQEADELLDLAEDRDLVIMSGLTFLYSPPVRKIKAMLEREELGDLYFISSSRVNLGLHQRDVSVIWDLGPHDFSILRYWMGEMPSSIRAVGRDAIVEAIPDVCFITLEYPNGVLANLELSWLAPSKLRRTVLVGSKKMVVYDDGAPEPVKVFDHGVVYEDPETFGQYHLSYRTGDILAPKLDTEEPIVVEMEDFLHAIRTGSARGELIDITRDVIRIAEAAEHSLRKGWERGLSGKQTPSYALS